MQGIDLPALRLGGGAVALLCKQRPAHGAYSRTCQGWASRQAAAPLVNDTRLEATNVVACKNKLGRDQHQHSLRGGLPQAQGRSSGRN